MRKFLFAALWASFCAPALFGLDTSKLKPTGYVNDFAHVLDPAAKQALESYAANLERATGAQMAIVLVPTLDNEPIDDVANRLYREWGIGKKGKDEGILILVATQDHKDRTEVGYGLEPIIPDGYAGSVLRGISPILRQGNYGGALLAAAEQYGQRIADEKGVAMEPAAQGRPARNRVYTRRQSIPWPVLLGGFFFLMWIIGKLSGGGRSGGGFGGGGGTGFLTGMILGNMMG
ncbi:MAG TPA: TPM domain-containing protein, partial [Bryobacteraceae bacterium]|nr:TPM domain-containing protein [Bryobacteraceae bacterium]